MPNYTHINLNDVENQAPNFGMPEEMEARSRAATSRSSTPEPVSCA